MGSATISPIYGSIQSVYSGSQPVFPFHSLPTGQAISIFISISSPFPFPIPIHLHCTCILHLRGIFASLIRLNQFSSPLLIRARIRLRRLVHTLCSSFPKDRAASTTNRPSQSWHRITDPPRCGLRSSPHQNRHTKLHSPIASPTLPSLLSPRRKSILTCSSRLSQCLLRSNSLILP